MKTLWPEFLVLALFLTGDLFWNGYASAAAGAAAGLFAFVILLAFKKNRPGLIVEGFVFGGITALGEAVNYPGGTLILMELVFAVVLLVSVITGGDIISHLTGGIGRGLFSRRQSQILSTTLGAAFLLHSVVCTVLAMFGNLELWSGGILFAAVYLLSLRASRSKMKKAVLETLPLLVEEQDGVYRVEKLGAITGRIRLIERTGAFFSAEIVSINTEQYEFLKQLETIAAGMGKPGISLGNWTGDEIELEMRGYTPTGENWRKRLR
ncbi:hypothetical protein DRQ21_11075 [Candidatus Fermentibacteria bacterium]|nr:MAG: hypothetical protein DRQ21_11075 [Candidatus Fermentibacteria bacterium]